MLYNILGARDVISLVCASVEWFHLFLSLCIPRSRALLSLPLCCASHILTLLLAFLKYIFHLLFVKSFSVWKPLSSFSLHLRDSFCSFITSRFYPPFQKRKRSVYTGTGCSFFVYTTVFVQVPTYYLSISCSSPTNPRHVGSLRRPSLWR